LKSLPDNVKALGSRLARPRVVLVLAILAVVFSVVTIYYYDKLAVEIDARLENSFLDNSVGIFTAPFKVSVGDGLPIDDFIDQLHAAGYQQRSGENEQNLSGSYRVEANAIEVFPGSGSALYPTRAVAWRH
jgi:hypothetical protein